MKQNKRPQLNILGAVPLWLTDRWPVSLSLAVAVWRAAAIGLSGKACRPTNGSDGTLRMVVVWKAVKACHQKVFKLLFPCPQKVFKLLFPAHEWGHGECTIAWQLACLPVVFCILQAEVSLCMQILENVQNYYRAGFERYINVLNEIVQHSKYLFSENNILAMTIIILFVETSTAQTLNRGHGKSWQQITLILYISHDKE